MQKKLGNTPKDTNSAILYSIFMVCAVIPLLMVSILISNILDNHITQDYLDTTQRQIRQVENTYKILFQDYMEKVDYLSKDYLVTQADGTITTYMHTTEEAIITPSINGGIEEEIYGVFERFAGSHPKLVYTFLGTKHGGYVQYPEGPVLVGYDPRVRPFYGQALGNNQIVKSPPYEWFGKSLISISKKVENSAGDFIGVVGIDINIRELAVLSSARIGDTGYVVLTQDDGTIIADSKHPQIALQHINDFYTDLSFDQLAEESFSKVTMDEMDYLVTGYFSPVLSMHFIAFIEADELAFIKYGIVSEMAGTGLVTLLVLAIFLHFAVRHVTRPISKLSESLDALSNYNFSDNHDEELIKYQKRKDEIGGIARAVDQMKTNIIALIDDLNISQARFRTLVSNVPGIVYRCANDSGWTMEFMSNEVEAISGYPSSDFINSNVRTYASVIHPDDRPEVNMVIQKALKKRQAFNVFYRLLRKDGTYRWTHGKGRGIFDGDGNLLSLDGVILDITEQKLAEKESYKQKAHFQSLFTSSLDAIVYFDIDENVSNINTQFSIMFGYSKEEVIGKNINPIINPFSKETEYLSSSILRGNTVEEETIRYSKTGQAINVHLKASPVYIDGVIIGGYAIYENIDARKHYEEELKYLSLHDKLTGVYNRTFFEAEITRMQNSRQYPITIMAADIDGLKLINDTLGHVYGDELLKSFANILKLTLRSYDIIARFGGDEFIILLPSTSEATSKNIVSRIQENVANYNKDNKNLPLSISIGTTTVTNQEISLKTGLKTADDAMYRSKLSKGANAKSQILNTLIATLGERDFLTKGHADRVSKLCIKLGKKIGLSSNKLDNLVSLAQVHDLGKVGIPDNILFKEGPLTEDEWTIMRQHSEKGYRIASSSPDLANVADLILKHHEEWDGSGYPLGLKGINIPIECRILSIVDAFDAITNDRPYSEAKSTQEAIEEIMNCSGCHFDPELVGIFLSIINEDIG